MVFLLFNALPGDPVSMMVGQRSDISTRDQITKELGLDKPLFTQFLIYLNDLSFISFHDNTDENLKKYEYTPMFEYGNNSVMVFKLPYLRRSFQTNKSVSEIIMEHVPGSFWLAMTAMVFATFLGIVFGVIASLTPNSFWDHTMVITSILGFSLPSFFAAILISWLFGYYWSDWTGLNLTGTLWVTDPIYGLRLELKNIILPAFTLGMRPLAIIVQLTRSSMLDVMKQDYIRTAHAKGLKNGVIIFKHALKNALNPVVTAISGWLASLIAGSFFIEYIFSWKGIGKITIDSVNKLDFPVVMGCTIFIATVFIVSNILVDVIYAMIDPRVSLE